MPLEDGIDLTMNVVWAVVQEVPQVALDVVIAVRRYLSQGEGFWRGKGGRQQKASAETDGQASQSRRSAALAKPSPAPACHAPKAARAGLPCLRQFVFSTSSSTHSASAALILTSLPPGQGSVLVTCGRQHHTADAWRHARNNSARLPPAKQKNSKGKRQGKRAPGHTGRGPPGWAMAHPAVL